MPGEEDHRSVVTITIDTFSTQIHFPDLGRGVKREPELNESAFRSSNKVHANLFGGSLLSLPTKTFAEVRLLLAELVTCISKPHTTRKVLACLCHPETWRSEEHAFLENWWVGDRGRACS